MPSKFEEGGHANAVEGGHADAEMRPWWPPICRGLLGCAPTTENIVIWTAAEIFERNEYLLVEPGRFYYAGVPRNVDQRLHDALEPVFVHIHRDDHTERRAILCLCRAIVRRCGYDGLAGVSGVVKMYIAHFPCISCLAVVSQFIRLLSSVRLELDFDNMWKTRWKYGPRHAVRHESLHYRGVRSLRQNVHLV